MKKLTTEGFIEKASKIHNNKYDYSESVYVDALTKVKIICPIHGLFEQIANGHLRGNGCEKCARATVANKQKLDPLEFIEKANQIHNNLYTYEITDSFNSKIAIKINCQVHGPFQQKPYNHLKGKGCQKCLTAAKQMMTQAEFISKAAEIHHNKFDYSQVLYINNATNIKIICPEHGIFEQRPHNHLYGKGCNKCSTIVGANKQRMDPKEFIEKAKNIHNNLYNYETSNYYGNKIPVKINCQVHGEFEQLPFNHFAGKGCPACNNSQGEKAIEQYLSKNNIGFFAQYKFSDCKAKRPLPFDFYLPEFNLCIEFDGEQHFKAIKKFGGEAGFTRRKKHDSIKNEYCKDKKINLLRISYLDIKQIDYILEKTLNELEPRAQSFSGNVDETSTHMTETLMSSSNHLEEKLIRRQR